MTVPRAGLNLEAWKEAVVNALVHRSYVMSSVSTFVRMFDDRIEVESPGGFPDTVRPDDQGVVPISDPRNATLARALQYFKVVLLAHEGTRRMRDAMVDRGLPHPELEEILRG